ncbi:hypothetical protein SAMN02745168_0615 [Papillibacter cinnamivorans DSM 12816]|uniref:Uncharacterized protein n=1 Tax=Papillibacter cinnamivorans DSM 12816 TaxID=1122930 RepID=A0A1W1YQ65_9FIRM|nr:hypothetical protein SAMN02745168_0615 [Papillibacter cinnamivorans DSM 12816]
MPNACCESKKDTLFEITDRTASVIHDINARATRLDIFTSGEKPCECDKNVACPPNGQIERARFIFGMLEETVRILDRVIQDLGA